MLKKENLTFCINLVSFDKILISKTDSDTVLILTKKNKDFFLKLSSLLSYEIHENSLFFFADIVNKEILYAAANTILDFLSSKSIFKKKLSLNGLGFKIVTDNETIDFKLGYSHLISLKFPKEVTKFIIKKKKLAIESADKIKLGNFAKKVYSLRQYDSYKAKGFSFLGVKKRLKDIKKK